MYTSHSHIKYQSIYSLRVYCAIISCKHIRTRKLFSFGTYCIMYRDWVRRDLYKFQKTFFTRVLRSDKTIPRAIIGQVKHFCFTITMDGKYLLYATRIFKTKVSSVIKKDDRIINFGLLKYENRWNHSIRVETINNRQKKS